LRAACAQHGQQEKAPGREREQPERHEVAGIHRDHATEEACSTQPAPWLLRGAARRTAQGASLPFRDARRRSSRGRGRWPTPRDTRLAA
jgi:hypothetical protein